MAQSSLLLLFGAGSSAPFGIPTMRKMVEEFPSFVGFDEHLPMRSPESRTVLGGLEKHQDLGRLDREVSKLRKMRNLWNFVTRAVECDNIEKILERLPRAGKEVSGAFKWKVTGPSPDFLLNVSFVEEEYHAHIEEAGLSEKRAMVEEGINRLAAELVRRIWDFIKRCCCVKLDKQKLERMLGPLFAVLAARNVLWDISTTNYDVVLETFLRNRRITYVDGTDINGVFDPSLYSCDSDQPRFLKLHGSIDFYGTPSGFCRIPSPDVRTLSDGTTVSDLMVYPGPRKKLTDSPFKDLLRQFRSSLRDMNGCVVVGYSFPDAHIRNALRRRIQSGREFRVTIVDPDAKEVFDRRLKSIGGDFQIVNKKLEEIPREQWDEILGWPLESS